MSGPYGIERGPTKVQAIRKAELCQPEENVGISDNVRRSLCSAASKIYKEDTRR